jgi:hypothetical protein
MSDVKNISFSDKELRDSTPSSEKASEEGVLEDLIQPKHNIFERCLSYLRLDTGDDKSTAGRWSNAGQHFQATTVRCLLTIYRS